MIVTRRILVGLLLAAVTISCGRGPGLHAPAPSFPSSYAQVPATWEQLARTTPVVGREAMVVSGHPAASEIGAQILSAGGNAVDAAVAVGFALTVVLPRAGNIGGGGFMVIRNNDGEVYSLDYREKAPAGATADMFQDEDGNLTDLSVIGHLAAGVPAAVRGLEEAHRRFGRLPWSEVVKPARELAARGHRLDGARAREMARKQELFEMFGGSRALYLPDGEPRPEGTLFVQPELAHTLELIADSGATAFYEGSIADLIVAEMERGGGLITHADLRDYTAAWREPVTTSYRGYRVISMPPSSSGGVTMVQALNILAGYDDLPEFGTRAQVHIMAEAMRRAFIDRNRYLGDPDYVEMPLDRLLSRAYAEELRATIDPVRASTTPPFGRQLIESTETTHYSVVDRDGNAVSVTTTLNSSFGNAVVVSGAGFVLNNEMDDFTGAPGQPNQFGLIQGEANAIRPGKRMLSAMTPSIVEDRDGNLLMVVGTPGGPTIITSVLQVISNVIDHGMTLTEAVAAPRIHHQSLPDQIYWEHGGLLPSVVEELERAGHVMNQRGGTSGIVSAIAVQDGRLIGVADPRYVGGAVGF